MSKKIERDKEYTFTDLEQFVTFLRKESKKIHLLFAYNGTGKTRLSMSFKEAGKKKNSSDTLYFNAFTEDLFYWDNDLDSDTERVLKINKESKFFSGLAELEMESRIRPMLDRYSNFDFFIDYDNWLIRFNREELKEGRVWTDENIKISRGEERLFIWCFFMAIMRLAIDKQEAYKWVKYFYIDDPISSLDDNNAIAVAFDLAQMIKDEKNDIKTIVSTHHALFYNVLCKEIHRPEGGVSKYLLRKSDSLYSIKKTDSTPFIYHVSMIKEIEKAIKEDKLYTYHFNILRSILEKAANFHGYHNFADCIEIVENSEDKELHERYANILSHGAYSLFEPKEMLDDNKKYFKIIFNNYLKNYKFNENLFNEITQEELE